MLEGADQARVTEELAIVATRPVGAPGTVLGVAVMEELEVPVPEALTAATVNV